jgi:hypothetical protein
MKKIIKLDYKNRTNLVQAPNNHEWNVRCFRENGWEYVVVERMRRVEPNERRRPGVIRVRTLSVWVELPSGIKRRIPLKETDIFYHRLFV